MIKVNSRIKMNWEKIQQLTQAQVTALEQTAKNLHTEVEQAQVIPFDTGNLQNESTFIDCSASSRGKVSIVHSTPYARKMYYHPEYNFQTKENKNARGEWYKDWLPGGSKENACKNAYKQFYKRITGV